MSMGSNKSSQSSRPLNAAERTQLYNAALDLLGQHMPGYSSTPDKVIHHEKNVANAGDNPIVGGIELAQLAPAGATNVNYDQDTGMLTYDIIERGTPSFANTYQAPQYYDPGAARTLSGGDYDRLEQSIMQARTAPLDRQYATDREMLDESLAKRGIWSSGLAARAQNDLSERYAPAYAQAGGEAAAQRYGLQAGEFSSLNNYALQNAATRNSFNMENALRNYDTSWRPADYLAGLWNGTGGQVSSGKSRGWNVDIPVSEIAALATM